MNYNYDYSVIGGDDRQVHLTNILSKKGKRVCHYGLCSHKLQSHFNDAAYKATTPEEAIRAAPYIIGPIPFCRNGILFQQTSNPKQWTPTDFLPHFSKGQLIFAGCIPKSFKEQASQRDVKVFDLMENLSFCRFNTIATAEGAICEAIRESPINLHGSRCAILGYGNCGTTLSYYLKGMFCRTFVASNVEAEISKASLIAEQAGTLTDFYKKLNRFDFIFNTIPSTILTNEHLSKVKPEVTIIDIASAPGGLNHQYAAEKEIFSKLCPGLPGTYAPLSSAEIIQKTIENLLKEEAKCL